MTRQFFTTDEPTYFERIDGLVDPSFEPERGICSYCGQPLSPDGKVFCSLKCVGASRTARSKGRFWGKVEKRGPDECWPWTGTLNGAGYGTCSYMGRTYTASRLAFCLHSGFTPASHIFVCHSCDNPPCCNPAHLFLGTNGDNQRDAALKGRFSRQSKTRCPRGHEYTPENTYRRTPTKRECRTCERARNRLRKSLSRQSPCRAPGELLKEMTNGNRR